jgi:hypothetical protein
VAGCAEHVLRNVQAAELMQKTLIRRDLPAMFNEYGIDDEASLAVWRWSSSDFTLIIHGCS